MPLELGEVTTSFVDRVSDLPLARGILSSPPFTALLLTALVAVVLMGMYSPALRAAGPRHAFRAALYFFAGALFVLLAHHSLLTRSARTAAANLNAREVHERIARAGWPSAAGSPLSTGPEPVAPQSVPPQPPAFAAPGQPASVPTPGLPASVPAPGPQAPTLQANPSLAPQPRAADARGRPDNVARLPDEGLAA
jgi:hypothetical protein